MHGPVIGTAVKGNKCKEVDDDAQTLPPVERTTPAG